MRDERYRILIQGLAALPDRSSMLPKYLVVHVPLESDREIPPMLRYAVLVVRLEEPSDDVRIVPVCPYSSAGDIWH